MSPRLAVVLGPLDGSLIPITGSLSIGRDSTNSLSIPDVALAARHCLITTHGSVRRLTHLGGSLPTFVNGLPVTEATLRHGDHIRIGASTLLVLLDAVDPGLPCDPFLRDLDPGSVVRLQQPSWNHRTINPSRSETSGVDSELDAALRIGTVLGSLQGLTAFERPLLTLLLDLIPADRAALLLAEGESPRLEWIVTMDREPDREQPPFQICRSLVDLALTQNASVLSREVRASETSGGDQRPRAVLASPVGAFGRMFGVLYLEAGTARLEEHQLRLLALIGEMAAMTFENRRHLKHLEFENRRLHAEIGGGHDMVGDSRPMQDVHRFITRVSLSESTVLLSGESGTGKELVARAIHRNSRRATGPFAAINCAAIAETLLETELFGHEKGAFTSAIARKLGKLEMARGGTVFLDEISELSLSLQPKLLRMLEERQCERVGGVEPIDLDIRIVAATNIDLTRAVASKRFRADLYYRLNVVSMRLPPLRARPEDIGPLAAHFARKYSERLRRRSAGITPDAEALMKTYHWPGNVRELANVIERALVLGGSDMIGVEDLPDTLLERGQHGADAPSSPYHQAVWRAKRDLILRAVEEAGGNLSAAARLLGLNANYLHRLIRDMDLRGAVRQGRHE